MVWSDRRSSGNWLPTDSAEDAIVTRTRSALDLTNQAAVREFFCDRAVDEVYLAAAKVGGIHANSTQPAEFIYENLMIEANVIDAAFRSGVKKLLFLGSSCIYPKHGQAADARGCAC